MKNIKCVIRSDSKRKDNERLIYLRYTYNRRFSLFGTDIYVSNTDWNSRIGRVRKSVNYELKNSNLTQMERDLEAIVLQLISQKKVPTLLEVKKVFYKDENQNQDVVNKPKLLDETLFLKDFKEFMEYQKDHKKVVHQTYKTYNTTYNKLADFQSTKSYFLHYNTINNEFYDKFLLFLREPSAEILKKKGINAVLADNSVDKHVKNTKLFMTWALSKEKHTNNVFQTFKRTRTKADFVVLDSEELRKLYYEYKPTGKDAKMKDEIRDAFVLGCSTGLRYGDLKNLSRGNFHISREKGSKAIIQTAADSYIEVKTEKTFKKVTIPFNHLICELIEKYDIENKEPSFLNYNSQLFNREIKTICKEAGITRSVVVTIKRGSKMASNKGPKSDFVSSHAMRRTFVIGK